MIAKLWIVLAEQPTWWWIASGIMFPLWAGMLIHGFYDIWKSGR